jgi:hypothetical protein
VDKTPAFRFVRTRKGMCKEMKNDAGDAWYRWVDGDSDFVIHNTGAECRWRYKELSRNIILETISHTLKRFCKVLSNMQG